MKKINASLKIWFWKFIICMKFAIFVLIVYILSTKVCRAFLVYNIYKWSNFTSCFDSTLICFRKGWSTSNRSWTFNKMRWIRNYQFISNWEMCMQIIQEKRFEVCYGNYKPKRDGDKTASTQKLNSSMVSTWLRHLLHKVKRTKYSANILLFST